MALTLDQVGLNRYSSDGLPIMTTDGIRFLDNRRTFGRRRPAAKGAPDFGGPFSTLDQGVKNLWRFALRNLRAD
jgi:hypothetical protein